MKAYPFLHKHPTTGNTTMSDGMDLRDYFAAKAMDIEMSGNAITTPKWRDEVAQNCYSMADAMLKARKEVTE